MSEVLSKRFRWSSLAFAMCLGGSACATTTGNGFLAPKGECISYETVAKVPAGKLIRVAARDLSVGLHNWEDELTVTNLDGTKVKLHKPSDERGSFILNGNVAEIVAGSDDVIVSVLGTSLEEANPVTYIEGGTKMDLRFASMVENVVKIAMRQDCPVPPRG